MTAPTPCPPRDYLIELGRRYPGAWRQLDEMHARRGSGGIPDWEPWCYIPIAAGIALVSQHLGIDGSRPWGSMLARVSDAARLVALAAWRMTQGIYRFDPAVFEAVMSTPVDGDIPNSVLFQLPEWCIYIETPGARVMGKPIRGAWVHLEHDANDGRPELRLLMDAQEGESLGLALHLGAWSLSESLDRMLASAAANAPKSEVGAASTLSDPSIRDSVSALLRAEVEPLISLVLYVCSQAGEISGRDGRQPGNPVPKKTRRDGVRLFAADGPTTWDVGVRLGAALRRAYQAEQTGQAGASGSPRAHIRRAHWHTFRSGPRLRPDGTAIPTSERPAQLRWMPPIAVNVDEASRDAMPAVIRPVRSSE